MKLPSLRHQSQAQPELLSPEYYALRAAESREAVTLAKRFAAGFTVGSCVMGFIAYEAAEAHDPINTVGALVGAAAAAWVAKMSFDDITDRHDAVIHYQTLANQQ